MELEQILRAINAQGAAEDQRLQALQDRYLDAGSLLTAQLATLGIQQLVRDPTFRHEPNSTGESSAAAGRA